MVICHLLYQPHPNVNQQFKEVQAMLHKRDIIMEKGFPEVFQSNIKFLFVSTPLLCSTHCVLD